MEIDSDKERKKLCQREGIYDLIYPQENYKNKIKKIVQRKTNIMKYKESWSKFIPNISTYLVTNTTIYLVGTFMYSLIISRIFINHCLLVKRF